MTGRLFPLPEDYEEFLSQLKDQIRRSQVKAVLAVNQELVLLYWQIGRSILERQRTQGWGAKVIERLAQDLRREFQDVKGFSRTNLLYMRAFAESYPDEAIVQQLAGQIPWFHNCVLLDKVKDLDQRLWYIHQTIENGWSRNVLSMQIESDLYRRQGGAITNFQRVLPQPQSDLAQGLLKDPYHLSFFSLSKHAQERDLERALVEHIREFLLELGVGFAFMGSQYRIEVDGDEYFLDLLFYHVKLRCYVVIDLKMVEFQPEFSGKMNFYVAAVNDLLRHPDDQPTIGIILCKSKKRTVVEYALSGMNQPIGVSTHQIGQLPQELQESLPTTEQLEMKLDAIATELREHNSESAEE